MADKSNLATARQLAYAILGSDGRDGRPNAMNGARDADLKKNHQSAKLTVKYINGLFDSPEAKMARAAEAKVYAERAAYKKALDDANKKITDLQKKIAAVPADTSELGKKVQQFKDAFAALMD